jgi:pimeloyl-ACP methyl ester carboxylesterase
MPMHAFFAQIGAIVGHSTGFRLGKIACPTVIMAGDEDILVPPRNSHVLAKGIPHAALEIVPAAGHGLPILDPAAVRRALDHLRALPRYADDSVQNARDRARPFAAQVTQ